MRSITQDKADKGGWVFMSFFVFFITFIAVDAFFVYKAISTNTGLVTENSYYKGLDYNKTLEEARIQKETGITGVIEYKEGLLIFKLNAPNGTPIGNAKVTAKLIRPVNDKNDFLLSLTSQPDMSYSAPAKLPANGQWTAYVEATWPTNNQYKTTLTFQAR